MSGLNMLVAACMVAAAAIIIASVCLGRTKR